MIEVKQKNDITPLCPHCSEPIEEVWFRDLKGTFGRRYVYFCSRCRKVLGVSHRKGFWMG
jgi:hypothetical protein